MTGDSFSRVRQLVAAAKMERQRDRLSEAYNRIREAIKTMEALLGDPSISFKDVHRELGDLYGREADILRQMGKDDAALRSHERGHVYEQLTGDAHYNRNNLPILLWLKSDDPADDLEIRQKLPDAVRTLHEYLAKGRHDDPWATGDFGILCLLSGRFDEALESFGRVSSATDIYAVRSFVNVLARIWIKATDVDAVLAARTKELFLHIGGDPALLVRLCQIVETVRVSHVI